MRYFAVYPWPILLAISFMWQAAGQEQEKHTLRMWVMTTDEEKTVVVDTMNEMVNAFLKDKPEIEISIVPISWGEADGKMKEAKQNMDKAPHISQCGSTWAFSLYSGGNILKSVEIPDSIRQKLIPISLESCVQKDGDYYTVPWFIDVRILYCNKTICAKANSISQLLDEKWDSETLRTRWNWEVIDKVCQEIKEKGEIPIAFSGQSEWSLLHNSAPWIWGSNKKGYEKVYEGIKFVVKLQRDYGEKENFLKRREYLEDLFLRGRYGMIVSGCWVMQRSQDYHDYLEGYISPSDIAILPVPARGDQKNTTFVGGSHLVLFNKTEFANQKLLHTAKEFIHFLLQPAQQKMYASIARVLPVHEDAYELLINDPNQKFKDQLLCLKKIVLAFGNSYQSQNKEDWISIELKLIQNLRIVTEYASQAYCTSYNEKTLDELLSKTEEWKHIVEEKRK